MAKPDRKAIDAVRVNDSEFGRIVGESLKGLRELAGLTQSDLAARLNVGRAAISKIENRGDVQIVSLKEYVGALGATLRIDAAFNPESRVANCFEGAVDFDNNYDSQLVLPIFGGELISARRGIVLSVRPIYSSKIFEGKKTVELRRRFPTSTPSGTIAYIYSTSPIRAVVGSTEIESVNKLSIGEIWRKFGKMAQITKGNFEKYFVGIEEGIALKLSNTRAFSRLVILSELRDRFGFRPPQSFLYASPVLNTARQNEYSHVPD